MTSAKHTSLLSDRQIEQQIERALQFPRRCSARGPITTTMILERLRSRGDETMVRYLLALHRLAVARHGRGYSYHLCCWQPRLVRVAALMAVGVVDEHGYLRKGKEELCHAS